VIAGSQYLADYTKTYNKKVSIIPTVIDINRYPVKQHVEKEELVIAWIGSPSTSIYLKEVIQVMETMSDYCQWRDNLENPKVNV